MNLLKPRCIRRRFGTATLALVLVGVLTWLSTAAATADGTSVRLSIIGLARDQLGEPYVFGAAGPDEFDCSGLVNYCYYHSGVAALQPDPHGPLARHLYNDYCYKLPSVYELLPGDLVFYGDLSHVGIYTDDSTVIDAEYWSGYHGVAEHAWGWDPAWTKFGRIVSTYWPGGDNSWDPGGGTHPNPPSCTRPAHESHFIGRPILDWEAVPGATKYQVRIGGYDSRVVTGSSFRLDTDLTPKAGYWWKARAGNSAGWSAWTTYPYRLWLAPYTEPYQGDATTGDASHNRWGWSPHNDLATIHGPDGECWKLKVNGCDSQIVSPPAYFGRACHQVDIEIANHTESQLCQLFWQRPSMSYFDQAHHVNAKTTVERSVAHATCYFHPDTIRLRFDPVAGCPGSDPETGGDPYVEWYRIGFRRIVTWPDWEFDVDNNGKGWWWDDSSKFHSLDKSIFPQDGVWRLRITGWDPFMVSPPTNLQGADYSGVEITMRNASDSGEAQFCWKTSEMSGFDAAHSVNFDAPNDSVRRTYVVPLTMSGTITGLRFDPSRGSSGNVYLEHIRLVPAEGVTLDPVGDKSGTEGELLEFTVSASSLSGSPLVFSASNLPPGASFAQGSATTATFSWTPTFSQSGTYSGVHFEVTDGTSTASEDITITVAEANRPPVMDPIEDRSVVLGEEVRFTVCASDPDGDPLTFISEELPAQATFTQIDATCAEYAYTPPSAGTFDGGWLGVSDGRGGTVGDSFSVHVAESLYILSLAAVPEDAGSVSVNGSDHSLPWSGEFAASQELELEGVPGSEASFSHWSGDLGGSANPATVTMDTNKSITANFIVGGRVLIVPHVDASTSATSIEVPVSLDDATGVAGIDFTLRFDPGVVQCQHVDRTELTGSFATAKNIDNVAGTCIVSMGSAEAVESGSGTVAVITFAPAASVAPESSSQLDLDACYLYDESANSIPVRPEDGSLSLREGYDRCDVNRDGMVTSADAILLLRAAVGLPAPEGWTGDWPPVSSNDVNCDGVINSGDAIIVLRVAVGIEECPSCTAGSARVSAVPGVVPRELSLTATTVSHGSTTLVLVDIDDGSGVAGADLEFSFNPAVVQFAAVHDGALTEGWLVSSNADNVSGTVSVSLASAEGIAGGGGTLLSLEFEPAGDALESSVVHVVSAQLYDESASLIESTVVEEGAIRIDFADVDGAHWAHDQIMGCVEAGIVMGYEDGTYQPELAVSRDQMAVYISRGLAGGDVDVPTGPATATFEDVPTDHWAYRYVEYAVSQDVVGGYEDGLYHPAEEVDRGQMAVYVARAKGWVGIDEDMTTAPELFPDVPEGHWAGTAIQACVTNEVVYGYDDGYYRPGATVTRDQMAVYVARAFDLTI